VGIQLEGHPHLFGDVIGIEGIDQPGILQLLPGIGEP
jgi:hypothetical protein